MRHQGDLLGALSVTKRTGESLTPVEENLLSHLAAQAGLVLKKAALYFCILEALQNIQKYARASSATVRLREEGDQLSVEVVDDGRGFDVSTTLRGNGLTNMEDRLDALGGTLHIASSPGNGTTLRVMIPVPHAVPVGG